MARARNIKPSFFTNDDLSELNPLARLLFIGMWTISDYKGCFEYKPKRLKVQLLPYDDCNIEQLVNDLDKSGFISIYSVQGQKYIKILNFTKHQNPHKNEREGGSPIPDLDQDDSKTCLNTSGLADIENNRDQNGTDRADSLNLIPDSLNLIPDNRDSRFDLSLNDVNTKLQMGGLKPISQEDLQSLLVKLQSSYGHKTQMVKNQILGKAFEWIERQQRTPLQQPKAQGSTHQTAAQRTASEMDRWKQGIQQALSNEEIDVTPKKTFLIEEMGNA